ncbi:MAG: TlpA family protein disulfide reductase [Bacteroides sp.]|nr:TlpA family protein disulfide reductase [Bacteroides sp.]
MRKLLITGLLAGGLLPAIANADITVNLPADSGIDSMKVYHAPILKLATAKTRADRGMVEETIPISDNKAIIAIDSIEGGSRYSLVFSETDFITLYVTPEETITANVVSFSPFDYTLAGSALIEGINEVDAISEPFEKRQQQLMASGQPSQEQMMGIYNDYLNALKEYIDENITSPNSLYAVMNLQGEDFITAFDRLSERAKSSILYPLAEAQYAGEKESLEKERRQQEMASGDIMAPDFILKDLEGKDVSLAQFKGKWVILDFWGSWCIWCIKGFPELKEAYEKYKDELVIVGIDCNESEEAWKAGVAKYELPWVNVYCPQGNPLLEQFGIQGFPTKAIIDPEGKIRNITTGHNPEFFTILSNLIGK